MSRLYDISCQYIRFLTFIIKYVHVFSTVRTRNKQNHLFGMKLILICAYSLVCPDNNTSRSLKQPKVRHELPKYWGFEVVEMEPNVRNLPFFLYSGNWM